MSRNMPRVVSALGTAVILGTAASASAQWLAADPCNVCPQPVVQNCFQTVPVTEYRRVTQTVQRPVVETKYIDQPVTEYRPVCEARTVDVPTVSYQTVTECQTVQRDAGFWITKYQPVPKVSPCEYDNRPDLLGWLNRTGYSIRSAFTPNYITSREYVPQTIVQNVPVTRQVAVHGTRQVTYNVTRMEPITTTRKVAVTNVRYVAEQVESMQPVTVMRTVPIGTTTAYAIAPTIGAPATVLQPTPEPASPRRTAEQPKSNDRPPQPREPDFGDEIEVPARKTSYEPIRRSAAEPAYPDSYRAEYRFEVIPKSEPAPAPARPKLGSPAKGPSIVRANTWVARDRSAEEGPQLVPPTISVAGN